MRRIIFFCDRSMASILVSASVLTLAACSQGIGDAASGSGTRDAAGKQLQADVAYLIDRQKIRDTYARFMRGFDRKDAELMRSAFWSDVQINYGKQSETLDEFTNVHMNEHTEGLMAWGHLLTNESVDLAGDVAHVETYVTRLSSNKNDAKSMIIAGRFIDRLERRSGEWRIAVREFIPYFRTETDTALGNYIKEASWSSSDCGLGTWDKRDPSYVRPLKRRENKEVGPHCAD